MKDDRKRTTVEFPNLTIEVIERKVAWTKEYRAKPRIYFRHDGENVMENLLMRTSRPQKIYQEFLGVVRQAVGFDFDTKIYWSQKAGCSCGCSPGFVVKSSKRLDVWVTIKGVPKTTGGDKLALRAAALGVTA